MNELSPYFHERVLYKGCRGVSLGKEPVGLQEQLPTVRNLEGEQLLREEEEVEDVAVLVAVEDLLRMVLAVVEVLERVAVLEVEVDVRAVGEVEEPKLV